MNDDEGVPIVEGVVLSNIETITCTIDLMIEKIGFCFLVANSNSFILAHLSLSSSHSQTFGT